MCKEIKVFFVCCVHIFFKSKTCIIVKGLHIPLNVWDARELDRAWMCCEWLCPPSVESISGVTQQCQIAPWTENLVRIGKYTK